ncbi:MAG: response regulator [Desulfobacterales bacterium]|nr:response regulator [Desulfobacterales bacterium]
MDLSQKPKILIVDDAPENIHILIEILKENYATIIATNGETALKKAQSIPFPDLILLDILMPDMDGYEVLRRLKAVECTKNIPVIFITAMNEVGDETKGLEIGAIDYITKPISPPIVLARVKNHLTLKKYRDHLEELVAERTSKLEIAMDALKQAMDALKSAKEKAESANNAKSNFLMIISHELRTPLNGILTAADFISSCDTKEDLESIEKMIKSSSNSLLKSIENILEFTKSKYSKIELIENPFRFNDILSKIKSNFFHKGENIQLKMAIELDENIPDILIGDSERILGILNHLMENSAKFTLNDPTAILSVKVNERFEEYIMLQFSLKDYGIGIEPENFEKVFEPFWQVDASISRHYDGAGIGLSLCKELVNLMRGEIWIESEINKGSTFHFTVNLKTLKNN